MKEFIKKIFNLSKNQKNTITSCNGNIIINGNTVCKMEQGYSYTFEIHGDVENIDTQGSITVHGNVGKIDTQGSVKVNGNCGDINTMGSVTVSGSSGNISTMGRVTIGKKE